MKNKTGIIITIIFLLDISCLIIFGKSYTKLTLFPPFFYIHDLALLLLSIFGIWYAKKENRVKSVEVLFFLAILYLIISFFRIDFNFHKSILTIRQFMLFGYGIYLYIIMNVLFSIEVFFLNSDILRVPVIGSYALLQFSFMKFILEEESEEDALYLEENLQ